MNEAGLFLYFATRSNNTSTLENVRFLSFNTMHFQKTIRQVLQGDFTFLHNTLHRRSRYEQAKQFMLARQKTDIFS